jgi:hypothetical protein
MLSIIWRVIEVLMQVSTRHSYRSRKNDMKKPYLALAALLGFSGYTLFTMLQADQSLVDFGLTLMSSPDTAQVVVDLYLLAVMACVWMYRDARAKGRSLRSVVPYVLLTAIFVSIGPLLYVVVNGFRQQRAGAGVAVSE